MLRALLARLKSTAEEVFQLELGLGVRSSDSVGDGRVMGGGSLLRRLRAFGLRESMALTLTNNRSVIASFCGPTLRLHHAFTCAPDDVLQAVVVFTHGRGVARRAARRVLLDYPIPRDRVAGTRRERPHPGDLPLAERLAREHARLNAERFGGALRSTTLRLSRRMRTRLGHYSPAVSRGGSEIVLSRRHIRRDGWSDALDTLLHEMVHQWQDEMGHPIDHGAGFRRKAREVGAVPRARRTTR